MSDPLDKATSKAPATLGEGCLSRYDPDDLSSEDGSIITGPDIITRGFIYVKESEDLMDELKENYTIIIVTHSMQQAARVSQKTAFFHLGSLIEFGETRQMFMKPARQETEDYITGRFG